ncbi:heptaprenyl diphosphate synthase component 1 [Oceanobacillus picturae]|uniref:heptaprenyl diphosphate synthase component 1 n=1 Tax=Oceanobacillus picturae TaxID=171693 RepID=UPI00363DD231
MTARLDIYHLKELLREKMRHAYLYKHIEKPILDQAKLILLTEIIDETSLSTSQKESYIITAMLVQVALDTHEKVPATSKVDEDKGRKVAGQLNVLAGDYYSGLYYLLLSEMKEIDLIHKLANAIKEINENKMKLYYNEASTFEDYLDILTNIESLLITSVANYVDNNAYESIYREWILTNRLLREKQNYLQYGNSLLIDAGIHYTDRGNKEDVLAIVNEKIGGSLQKLSLFMENYANKETILGEAIQKLLKENSTLAEEG